MGVRVFYSWCMDVFRNGVRVFYFRDVRAFTNTSGVEFVDFMKVPS